jgi:tetratricopeptide (TPR) repeat protein
MSDLPLHPDYKSAMPAMTPPEDGPRDAAVLAGMEGLIVAMKGQRRAPTGEAGEEDDELGAAACGVMNLSLSNTTDGVSGAADGGGAHLERGAVVGRYVVLRELGAGGMGVVYAAYDPELDRRVALKLVLPGTGGGETRTRLLREAQVLAKLSHRNVVAIHDVGTMGEQVWLAMELVRGQTLREWLKEPRDWREVLGVMRKAGRGLAAAHASKLLHRDFKPDNVMVGKKGGVKVMDFGLARARSTVMASVDPEVSMRAPVPAVNTFAMGVTEVGMLVGTPLYMAPEQHLGGDLTPAADQFSLCVTLWEALYGERPFGGETLDELVGNMLAGRVREPPKGRGVPGWLRRVCERGLSEEPRWRHASVEGLLDALAKGRVRARIRKSLAAVGVLAVLGMGAEVYRRWDIMQRTAACEASGDEVEVAWNPERKQELHDALVATGVSYAPTTAEKVTPWLDKQAAAWREARVEACLDGEVRDRWDAKTLDRSLWCLDERRMELESLVDELILADAEVLLMAVQSTMGLASVDPCRDENVLEGLAPPPEEDREAVRVVRADVTRAGTLKRAGRYEKGLELSRGALEQAEALQWRPLSAAARCRLGSLLHVTGAYAEAESVLEDAYFEAADGVAPEVVFNAAVELVVLVGVGSARPAEGRRWGRHAEVALASVRDAERPRWALLHGGLAAVHWATGAYDEAKALQEQALTILESALGPENLNVAASLTNLAMAHAAAGAYEEAKALQERALAIQEQALGPEHPEVAGSLNNLANLYEITGVYDEAITLNERALAINEKARGPEHPYVAGSLNNLAIVHNATGAYDEAKALYERALAIQEKALGLEHPSVAGTLDNLAVVHQATGAYDEAKALNERALAIHEKALGPEHPSVAGSLTNLANVHEATGAYDEAKALLERAVAIREKALGPEHPDMAMSLTSLATVHMATGAYDEAKALLMRAVAILEKALGVEHPDVAYPLVGLATVALAQHRPIDALPLAQRAVALREKGGVATGFLAEARFVLAQALWESPVDEGRDRARAVTLAKQARDVFRDLGKGFAEVEQWLDDHGNEP